MAFSRFADTAEGRSHRGTDGAHTGRPSPGKQTLTAAIPLAAADAAPTASAPSPHGAVLAPPRGAASAPPPQPIEALFGPPRVGAAPVQRRAGAATGPRGDGAAAGSMANPAGALPAGPGGRLPAPLQAKMEQAFGADFSGVRIHQGPEAEAMGALAYTQGADIHFAPGQYDPDSQRGQELLGHELAHVVQQGQGRVRATTQAKGRPVNDDAALEREADEQGMRAARGEPAGAQAGQAAVSAVGGHAAPLQAKWQQSPFGEEYYEWDVVVQGVRWYSHRQRDAMYFVVGQMTEENQKMVQYQKQVKPHDEWQKLGFAPPDNTQESVSNKVRRLPNAPSSKLDSAPFVFGPVGHKEKTKNSMEVNTAYRMQLPNKPFAKAVGGAEPKLQNEKNLGKYVFHLTTYRNLMIAPDNKKPGILSQGLVPFYGGGRGGACETSRVTGDKAMIEGSEKNSKGTVAVNTAPSNIKLYANQRFEDNETQFGKGLYTATDLVEREPVLLRFRLTEDHLGAMEIDPQHPNDDFVRLIRGIVIPPSALEALTARGWQPLTEINPEELREMMPNLVQIGKRRSGDQRRQPKPVDKSRKQRHGKQQRQHLQNTIEDGRELAKHWDHLDEDWESDDSEDELDEDPGWDDDAGEFDDEANHDDKQT